MKPFFAFSGQGAQAVGMGKDLYEKYPAAKAIFDEADATLGYKISEICFEGPAEKLTETIYCQPAIYTMSVACLEAFRSRFGESVLPTACAGLSLGEYGALYAAGTFSFAEGLKLLARRAELMDKACNETKGAMASVISRERKDRMVIKEICGGCEVDIANYNSPAQVVISGDKAQVIRAIKLLQEKGLKKIIPLNVAGAFHSRLMKSAGVGLKPVLSSVGLKMPAIPVYHNLTAAPAATLPELKANLAGQVAGSVRWEESVTAMVEAGADTMIEFGPGNVLTGLMRRTLPDVKCININSVETLEAFEL